MSAILSFERLDNESQAAFEKFKIYRDLGLARRSLRAAYRVYLRQQVRQAGVTGVGQKWGESGAEKEIKNVPGQWIRLAKKYFWKERVWAFETARWEKEAKKREAELKAKIRQDVQVFHRNRGFV